MTLQFKKFLMGLAAVFLGAFTMSLLIWLYILTDPISFGGEVIFFTPVLIVGAFLYYRLLKKLFRL